MPKPPPAEIQTKALQPQGQPHHEYRQQHTICEKRLSANSGRSRRRGCRTLEAELEYERVPPQVPQPPADDYDDHDHYGYYVLHDSHDYYNNHDYYDHYDYGLT